jgi:hypothetical protein
MFLLYRHLMRSLVFLFGFTAACFTEETQTPTEDAPQRISADIKVLNEETLNLIKKLQNLHQTARHWKIEYTEDKDDKTVYANGLDYFKIELGILVSKDEIAYAYHLCDSKTLRRTSSLHQEKRVGFISTGKVREYDQALLKRAGIEAGDCMIIKFIPADVEAHLIALEKQYRKTNSQQVEKFAFGIRAGNRTFDFYILNPPSQDNEMEQNQERKENAKQP